MALFHGKQKSSPHQPIDENSDGVQRFFDTYFQDLRTRGNKHFEKMLDDRLSHFKSDLDGTVSKVNTDLKQYIVKQIDEEVADNDSAIKQAQQHALESMRDSAQALEGQHRQLSESLQKNAATQQAKITQAFEDHVRQMTEMKSAQDAALRTLQNSVASLEKQQQDFTTTLENSLKAQQEHLTEAFAGNMATVIEHYLFEAIGDQYDLKSQMPAILAQLEENKQDMVDDMKL